ncbi:MAG: aspartate aminotransferase family protein, partial [Candidatus Limnocylindrales bacterium]
MTTRTNDSLMRRTADLALRYLGSLDDRPVAARAGRDQLLTELGGTLPDDGVDALQVIEDLAAAADP